MFVDDPLRLQARQAIGQDVPRDALVRGEEVAERGLALEREVADDEQRPSIAEQIEGEADRTVGATRANGHDPILD